MYGYDEYDDPAYARGLSQKYVDYINALMEVKYMTQERAEQYFDLAKGYAILTWLRIHSEEVAGAW